MREREGEGCEHAWHVCELWASSDGLQHALPLACASTHAQQPAALLPRPDRACAPSRSALQNCSKAKQNASEPSANKINHH